MQKKQTFFIVLGLAVLSVLVIGAKQNYRYLFFGRGMMDDTFYPDQVMPMEVDGDYGMGMMPDTMPSVTTSKIAAEPMIGILPPYYDDNALDNQERSYQKSSYHSVVVDDVSTYLRGMKEYFLSVDGVVINSSVNANSKYESGSLYVKVPVAKFDEATNRVTENVKKVMDENISAQDITGQVVNTAENVTYLKEQKELKEAQLQDAKTEVEKKRIEIEIARLDRQIVSAEKSQENVEARTEYASVSVTAADNERYFNPDASGDVRYEFEKAWESLKNILRVGLLFTVWIAVYSIVWLPIVWIVGKVIKKLKGN